MQDLLEMAKQWVGLAPTNNLGGLKPGIASLAGLFGGDSSTSKRSSRRQKSSSGAGGMFGSRDNPVSSRTRNKKTGAGQDHTDPDIISSILNSAADLAGNAGEGDWQRVVQDFVKKSLVKATGLEWLLGKSEEETQEGASWRSR